MTSPGIPRVPASWANSTGATRESLSSAPGLAILSGRQPRWIAAPPSAYRRDSVDSLPLGPASEVPRDVRPASPIPQPAVKEQSPCHPLPQLAAPAVRAYCAELDGDTLPFQQAAAFFGPVPNEGTEASPKKEEEQEVSSQEVKEEIADVELRDDEAPVQEGSQTVEAAATQQDVEAASAEEAKVATGSEASASDEVSMATAHMEQSLEPTAAPDSHAEDMTSSAMGMKRRRAENEEAASCPESAVNVLQEPTKELQASLAAGLAAVRPLRRLRKKTRYDSALCGYATDGPDNANQLEEVKPASVPDTPTPRRSQDGCGKSNTKQTKVKAPLAPLDEESAAAAAPQPRASSVLDEEARRTAIGHTLRPANQGRRVAVVGDGWGGGGDGDAPGYEAMIIEADDLSFTVVALSGPMKWQETHVLQEHCIEVSDAALGTTLEDAVRQKKAKTMSS